MIWQPLCQDTDYLMHSMTLHHGQQKLVKSLSLSAALIWTIALPPDMKTKRNRTGLGRGNTLYLHVMTVHKTVHDLLEEEARLRLSKPLPLPHIIQKGTPLCQLHHLKKWKADRSVLQMTDRQR